MVKRTFVACNPSKQSGLHSASTLQPQQLMLWNWTVNERDPNPLSNLKRPHLRVESSSISQTKESKMDIPEWVGGWEKEMSLQIWSIGWWFPTKGPPEGGCLFHPEVCDAALPLKMFLVVVRKSYTFLLNQKKVQRLCYALKWTPGS
jgi:hypothetical protein